ncbi:MAG: DUF2867 domain-containing protein [Deltaproteobacteria bacterium HGW-Deltaproteobacteria-4]|nr:MAG: DUF2867 domain-containing protein [Deltaproteobacteria bacterium HGW-Deltaproteobacteria-4]
MTDDQHRPILIAGASGYVGARLVPRLLDAGFRVRTLARTPAKIASQSWGQHPRLQIVQGDVLAPESLQTALSGCQCAFYLVHSMNAAVKDFAAVDRKAAENFIAAAAQSKVERIIYLTGLGEDTDQLSEHLRSRAEVARIFQQGKVPATILRAGVILGSGSASFEILRYLVDRLPVMVTPRWIDTPCQPISIINVLHYLVGVLSEKRTTGEVYDIGQEEVISYRKLMEVYAEEAQLPRRIVIPVPVLTPRLSSYWINLVTPLPAALARPLVEGLRNPVICHDTRIRSIIPQHLLDCREAIHQALEEIRMGQVLSSWRESGAMPPAEWRDGSDPQWAGGTCYVDARTIEVEAQSLQLWRAITSLGGSQGWYFANFLWQIRGLADRIVGGVGLQRGRRCPLDLRLGDTIDFWRVTQLEKESRLLLIAEMKVPGVATLEFTITKVSDGIFRLQQTARFRPRGLAGILYWYSVLPAHHIVFNGMLKGIAAASGGRIRQEPQRVSQEN